VPWPASLPVVVLFGLLTDGLPPQAMNKMLAATRLSGLKREGRDMANR
jgi:hypothetical protein